MKNLKLLVLSLAALVFARPAGFCTANSQADDIRALQEQLARQEEELKALRAATTAPAADPVLPGSLAHLIKGAGVDEKDVLWRVRSGLDPAQAVEVALLEKKEAEIIEARKKEGKK